MEEYKIKHRKSTPYHPQVNVLVESTNKVIEAILTKTMHLHRRDWAEKLLESLWHIVPHGETLQGIHPMNFLWESSRISY